MAKIKARNTRPELVVRRALTAMGIRYRLHRRDIPGTPDIAFIGRRKAIFVHGCWWHGHACREGNRPPKSNQQFWADKVAKNIARDHLVAERLQQGGWTILTIWECEARAGEALDAKLRAFFDP